jgi:hypothetical protein
MKRKSDRPSPTPAYADETEGLAQLHAQAVELAKLAEEFKAFALEQQKLASAQQTSKIADGITRLRGVSKSAPSKEK